jgi:predicted nucleic acid-binding protein
MIQKWILNASPLILLHKIDFLETMSKLSEIWLIPEAVAQEIGKKRPINDYVTQLSVKSHVDILKSPYIIPSIAAWDMGLGESEVLCHALEMGNAGVILDDLQARKCARLYNIPLKGSIGIIVWAKKEGIIDKLEPHFDNLVTVGIRIDENLMEELLRVFGEY